MRYITEGRIVIFGNLFLEVDSLYLVDSFWLPCRRVSNLSKFLVKRGIDIDIFKKHLESYLLGYISLDKVCVNSFKESSSILKRYLLSHSYTKLLCEFEDYLTKVYLKLKDYGIVSSFYKITPYIRYYQLFRLLGEEYLLYYIALVEKGNTSLIKSSFLKLGVSISDDMASFIISGKNDLPKRSSTQEQLSLIEGVLNIL